VKIKRIGDGLDTERVVRVMPNTPAQIGKGISGWYAGIKISDDEKKLVRRILQSFGEEVEVGREELIDSLSTISGAGPAYVFLFLEALASGGVKLGLDRAVSEKLALHTLLGATELAVRSDHSFETLIDQVASKGGVTEQALHVFNEAGWSEIVHKAMKAALDRTQELYDMTG
jgi:pyrroline-5-carboxylate reductase